MSFSNSKGFPLNSLTVAFLVLAPSPPLVQLGGAPPQAPLEPLNTLYQILDSMVKVMVYEMVCLGYVLSQVYGNVPFQQFRKMVHLLRQL